jgi:hypothetical protein
VDDATWGQLNFAEGVVDRSDWMWVRAIAPGAVLMVGALLMAGMLAGLPGNPVGDALFGTLRWGPVILFGLGFLFASYRGFRVWQAVNGVGLMCSCGGPLGGEIDGRYGPYRKCMGCGRNVSRKHYE